MSNIVKTNRVGDTTTATVDGPTPMTITIQGGEVAVELAGKQVHVDPDVQANLLSVAHFHPGLAYAALELRDEMAAGIGRN
jgi:hypothetical protein